MPKKNEGIVIGTKLEAMWTTVKEARENTIKTFEEALIVEKAILQMAKNKILLEKRK